MEILILSALIACAAAAPSGAIVGPVAPVPIGPVPAIPIPGIKTPVPAIPIVGVKALVAIPVAAPTISPGDIQAAAINAKVEVEDYLRAAADKNKEINEQALKDQADKIVEASNQNRESNEEAFWSVEDKKWQALTALQTAQAQIEGLVASNAELLGQTLLKPTPIVPGVVPVAPVITPALARIPPYVIGTLAIKEEKKEEGKEEAIKTQEIKTEEAKPEAIKSEGISQDSVQVESADSNEQAAVRTPAAAPDTELKMANANVEAKLKEGGFVAPVVANLGFPLYAPIAGVPVNFNEVGWQATLLQPGVKIITPGLPVAQGGLVASVARKSSW